MSKDEEIIDEIEAIRVKNNKNWMDLLRLAFKSNPVETKEILVDIYKKDESITKLVKKLCNGRMMI